MPFSKFLGGAALSIALASTSFGIAQAQVYDGLSYPQFKAILSTTNLGLTEQVTSKGNRYLLVMVPGWTVPFVATSAGCAAGQNSPCDGFAYFFIDTGHTLSAGAMGKFNEGNFVKVFPVGDKAAPTIKGDYYARGGVTDQNVLSAGAYYSVVLQGYLGASGASAMNGTAAAPGFDFTDTSDPEMFFAKLAGRGKPKAPPAGAKSPAVEAAIDALVGSK
jgi:hypothetical protein